jgi:hypothetical protein
MAVNIVTIYGPGRNAKRAKAAPAPGPGGGTPATPAAKRGLGDMVERVFHPVAVALRLPCNDQKTGTLKPESPCAKRRDKLNELGKKAGIG